MEDARVDEMVEDLFRREFAHLVAALVRVLGPSNVALAEDVVHDALVTAMQSWRLAVPEEPKAWLLQVARRRAIDVLRRERRLADLEPELASEQALTGEVDRAFSPEADAENQLAMMFALCDEGLSAETHVTLILRLLCGLSPAEIARAFLVDVATIDRRLHRGRARLQSLERLHDVHADADVRARQPSVERALYLLFNEGYHGSDPDSPLHPVMCADALRFVEMLLSASAAEPSSLHALAALFCFHGARLSTRLDGDGVLLPLAEQDRTRWDSTLVARGIAHLGASTTAASFSRWHLEAGIAFEHTRAPSVQATDWARVVELYDALLAMSPSPVVALNRALAVTELRGLEAGRAELLALGTDPKLASYSFHWAARADLERRSGHVAEAQALYRRAASLSKSRAERESYERRRRQLDH